MNRDFEFFNPTQVFFGKTAMDALPAALEMFGENVLLAYGGGSIQANGVYDQVTAALRRAGKRVPEDVSIVGYDGIAISDFLVPRLTTVRQNAQWLAERGVDVLLRNIERSARPFHEVVPFQLIHGESVARLKP